MNTQFKLILALGVLCAGSILWFALTPSVPPTAAPDPSPLRAARLAITRPDSPVAEGALRQSGFTDGERSAAISSAPQAAKENADGEPVSVAQWQARFSVLLNECGNREEASARVISEMDEKFFAWVSPKVAALADLPSSDRYDSLAQMDARMRTVVDAILGHLEITGAPRFYMLANTLEAISAETQYAELTGTHDQRVAMLRLDRERESRFGKLVAVNGLGHETEMQVRGEIEPWYESELRGILRVDETN